MPHRHGSRSPIAADPLAAAMVAVALIAAALTMTACGTVNPKSSTTTTSPGKTTATSTTPNAATPAATTPTAATFDPDTYRPRTIATATLLHQFAYDSTAPLRTHPIDTRHQDGVSIQRITYAAAGHAIDAQIVFPTKAHGRLPGVVFAHGGAIDPDAFLADAIAIVKHGAVAVLPDLPITMVGEPKADLAYVTASVVAERRALDVLAARPDVDVHRLAFVGHSWGADLAGIMAGIEPRLAAVAIVCGWSRMSTDMLVTAGRPTTDAPARTYLVATTVLDAFRYVAIPGKRKVLLQYGRLDPNIPDAQRTELTARAVGSVSRKDYDAGHDLINDAAAAADRLTFLIDSLR